MPSLILAGLVLIAGAILSLALRRNGHRAIAAIASQAAATVIALFTVVPPAINTSMGLCGSRFGRGAMRPGGLGARLGVDGAMTLEALRRNLALLRSDTAVIDDCLLQSRTVQHRLVGVGQITRERAAEFGLVGPAARASGVEIDARSLAGGVYADVPVQVVVEPGGDCWARTRIRVEEIRRSLAWIDAAITLDPVRLDLGRCVFCAECVVACPEGKLGFTPDTHIAAATRGALVSTEGELPTKAVATSAALKKLFGRSLRLRQVSAGGCHACELELNALANVNFDLQRFGIEWVASPRHADALALTGPITRNMADAVRLSWEAMPDPKFLIAFGACTISGGLYADATGTDRGFLDGVGPSLFVPGCPPHPLTFVNGILDLLGIGTA